MAESDIQGAAEGTGPHVRTAALTRPQGPDASGNAQADEVVHQQIVTLADSRGDVTTSSDVLDALAAINETLHLILSALS